VELWLCVCAGGVKMSRPLFPLCELLRRGVRREWIRNKWLTLGDGTRHYVHENHVQWLRIYLNTIDRHVPPNAQGSVLMEDENLQTTPTNNYPSTEFYRKK